MATNSSRLDRIKGLVIPPDSDSKVDPELLELLREILANATGNERGVIIQDLNPDGCYIELLENSGLISPPAEDNPRIRHIYVEAFESLVGQINIGRKVDIAPFLTIDGKEVYVGGNIFHPNLYLDIGKSH